MVVAPLVLQMLWTSMVGSKKAMVGAASEKAQDSVLLKQPIEAGKIRTVIDRSYPLERIVEAHRYVEKGGKLGHVVITVEHNSKT